MPTWDMLQLVQASEARSPIYLLGPATDKIADVYAAESGGEVIPAAAGISR
jgi:hypothetical protein